MRKLLWLLFPCLVLFAPEALAWGLQTHVVLAEMALAALPMADAALRHAAAAHPALVLAGACLPDLFLAGRALGSPAFRRSHRWSTLRRMAGAMTTEPEMAMLTGYASHLVTDIVAHNHFVPEHEARIARIPHATHALAEWAMDHFQRCAGGWLASSTGSSRLAWRATLRRPGRSSLTSRPRSPAASPTE